MTALDTALAAIEQRAPVAYRHDVKVGAKLMLSRTWRIQSALFPRQLGNLPDEVDGLIRTAERQVRYANDFNRRVAAMQARLALRWLRLHHWTSLESGPVVVREAAE